MAEPLDRDRYGGLATLRFAPTGFFRVEHDGRRWWLVTPDGGAFISFGVNHYHTGWWAQDYNRDHWLERFRADRVDDANWRLGFRRQALIDLRRLGLNTLGVHTSAAMLTDPPAPFPYVGVYEPLKLSHYLHPSPDTYVDVFASPFETLCDTTAQALAGVVDDPMLLGWCMADGPPFTDDEAAWNGSTTWPRRLRNFAADAPGKRAYVNAMRVRYPTIDAFNTTYATNFSSWDGLLEAVDWRADAAPINAAERADNAAFLVDCVHRYYSIARRALRRVDANHLFLGDKINGNGDGMAGYGTVAAQYTDLVNVQYYARWPAQRDFMNRWTSVVGKPFLNGDSAFSVPTAAMPSPYGPRARDQDERAAWTHEYMANATARSDFVGWHICGIIDTTKDMPGKDVFQHQGLMTTHGDFYPPMATTIRDLADRLYDFAR